MRSSVEPRTLGMRVVALASVVVAGLHAESERRLPSWVTLHGEIRGRAEMYAGSNRVPGKTEWYYMNRLRLNTGVEVNSKLRFFAQLQDSRAAHTDGITPAASMVNQADLRQAYIEIGAAAKGWQLRAGRQPLSFGAARLLWMSEWGNVGPGFDGAKLAYLGESASLNFFGAAAVRNVADGFDRPRADRQIYGFFASFPKLVPKSTIEPFVLWKHNKQAVCEHGTAGDLDVITYGIHGSGNITPKLDWSSDLALQAGHISQDKARAWAGNWEFGFRPVAPVRVFGEYQRASGDTASADGTHGSFDQLYAAWKFGTADPIGWSNTQEGVAGLEWNGPAKWQGRASYHHFWLLSLNDCLYSNTGAVLARHPSATSKRIGGEWDIRFTRSFARFTLMAGVAKFSGGPYWQQSRGTRGITYPFLVWHYTL